MKLVSYRYEDEVRGGCVVGDEVIDLNRAYQLLLQETGKTRVVERALALVPADNVALLEGGEESLALAKEAVDFVLANREKLPVDRVIFNRSAVKLEAPVLKPSKILCVGHNYREHILEMGREIPKVPVIFAKFNNTIIGPEDDIPLHPVTNQLDYEAEFAFVIGKKARYVSEEEGLDYVAGYTIANDVSARDLQMRTLQWLQGKTLDGSCPMGPWLVTKEDIPDPHQLEISLKVNGEERQRSNTKNLVFNVNRLVSFLSEILTLEPGDVILTGTPGGVGVARDPKVFLQDGDVVTIEVDQIGTLENRVRAVGRA
jgi:acylpyruvate hydrolase